MKFSALALFAVGTVALESLTESINDIPSCAVSALKDAMTAEGCSVTKNDADELTCMCKHLSAIVVRVTGKLDGPCDANLSTAFTNICANWQLYSTTATDYPQATKALGDKLGGSGGSGSGSSGSSSAAGASSPTSAGSNSQGSSSSKAAAPTAGVGGLVGGAAAVAAYAALF